MLNQSPGLLDPSRDRFRGRVVETQLCECFDQLVPYGGCRVGRRLPEAPPWEDIRSCELCLKVVLSGDTAPVVSAALSFLPAGTAGGTSFGVTVETYRAQTPDELGRLPTTDVASARPFSTTLPSSSVTTMLLREDLDQGRGAQAES